MREKKDGLYKEKNISLKIQPFTYIITLYINSKNLETLLRSQRLSNCTETDHSYLTKHEVFKDKGRFKVEGKKKTYKSY